MKPTVSRTMFVTMLLALPGIASANDNFGLLGIPIEFILFGLTLLGVALLHNQTFNVALTGVVAVALYKIVFTGFKTGAGVAGFAGHLGCREGDIHILGANTLHHDVGFA